jgi:hypothetical protein
MRTRKPRLTASWIVRSVSGGTSATACLLTAVPTPQQAAARIRKRALRLDRDGLDIEALRA